MNPVGPDVRQDEVFQVDAAPRPGDRLENCRERIGAAGQQRNPVAEYDRTGRQGSLQIVLLFKGVGIGDLGRPGLGLLPWQADLARAYSIDLRDRGAPAEHSGRGQGCQRTAAERSGWRLDQMCLRLVPERKIW